MKYKIFFRRLTNPSDTWVNKRNPHVSTAEEMEEVVVDAQNLNHAMHIFMSLIEHHGIKVADYRIEELYKNG